MKLELNKNRWISRQSAAMQVLVFFIIFFLSSIIGQWVADLLFGDPVFYEATTAGLRLFFIKNSIFSLLWAIAVVYFIHRQKSEKSTTA